MNYPRLEDNLQAYLTPILPLTPASIKRLVLLCVAIFRSSGIHLSYMARCLSRPVKQDSAVKWIYRLLEAVFMKAEFVYHPLFKHLCRELKLKEWHLIIDRTALDAQKSDLVSISLYYHKRAIPIVWQIIPYGGVPLKQYVDLVHACARLLPPKIAVVFHGDSEFGGREMIECLLRLNWHFILAQPAGSRFCPQGQTQFITLRDLILSRHATRNFEKIRLFSTNPLENLNLVAFQHRKRDAYGKVKHEALYLVTSLPLSRPIRSLGRLRWGIELFHKDFKSSGWQIQRSHLQKTKYWEGLVLVLALCYLLSVALGRFLSKTGRRSEVDSSSKRRLSLFRIGWDFILRCLSCSLPIPLPLRLYP